LSFFAGAACSLAQTTIPDRWPLAGDFCGNEYVSAHFTYMAARHEHAMCTTCGGNLMLIVSIPPRDGSPGLLIYECVKCKGTELFDVAPRDVSDRE
jgi:hypothetical protein